MKTLRPNLTLILVIVFIQSTFANTLRINDPAPIIYGEISKEDFVFNIEDYPDFEAKPSAVILCDYGQEFYSEFNGSHQTRTVRHRRIIILDKSGLEEADIKVWIRTDKNSFSIEKVFAGAGKYGPYWVNERGEGIFRIQANSYSLDGEGNIVSHKLDKSNIYVSDATDMVGYDAVGFAIPGVKVGSIIEYTYTTVHANLRLSTKWFFQYSLPCLHSEFRIANRETDSYAVIRNGLLKADINPVESEMTSKQFRKFKQKVYKFELDNVPGMPEQDYISTMDNYRANILIQLQRYWNYRRGEYKTLMSTWEELSKEYLKNPDFGKQLFRFDAFFENIKTQLPQPETVEEEIELCYNFVRDYFVWNGLYRRMPYYNLKEVYENQTASGVEINLFLARLLREFGINSKMAFVSTQDNGWVNKNYPFILQFNHAIASVQVGKNIYFLDAIDKHRTFNMPPSNLLETKAFILDMMNPEIVNIRSNTIFDMQFIDNISFSGDTIKNYITGKFKGYAGVEFRDMMDDDALFYLEEYYTKDSSDVLFLNYENPEKPLLLAINYNQVGGVQFIDSLMIIDMNEILKSDSENPFKSDKRDFPIEISYGIKNEVRYNIYIPDGYQLESNLENQTLILSDKSAAVDAIYQCRNGLLQIRLVIQTANNEYTVDQYQELKGLFELWEQINNEPIVFSKK